MRTEVRKRLDEAVIPDWDARHEEVRQRALREVMLLLAEPTLKANVLHLPESPFERLENWPRGTEYGFVASLMSGGINGVAAGTGLDWTTILGATLRLAMGARLPDEALPPKRRLRAIPGRRSK